MCPVSSVITKVTRTNRSYRRRPRSTAFSAWPRLRLPTCTSPARGTWSRPIASTIKLTDARRTVTLIGRAKSSEDATALARRLDEHAAFDAELKGTNPIRGEKGFDWRFTIELSVHLDGVPRYAKPNGGGKS